MRFSWYGAVAVVLAALSVCSCSYSKFAAQEQAVKDEWAEVHKDLQRRSDLIPQLVEVLRSSGTRESQVLQEALDSRAQLAARRTPAEVIEAANQQSAALARLLALVENYPQAKANDSFSRLINELADVENRIAVERMRYNAFVQQYNMSRRRFPGALTALVSNARDHPFFEVPATVADVPKVPPAPPKP